MQTISDSIDRNPLVRTPLWAGVQIPLRFLTTLLFDLRVYGTKNVPKTGGALILSNHQSFLDPVVLAVQLHRPVSFLARSGLFSNPVFGRVIRTLNAFPVRQGEGDIGAVKETIRRLREGHALIMYPEGSRTETGELSPVASGAGLIVRRAGVPVIPAVVEGSFKAWPKGQKFFRPARINVLYGPPLQTDGLKGPQITALIDQTLAAMLIDLRNRMRND